MTLSRDQYIGSPLPIDTELRAIFDTTAKLVIFDVGACEGEDAIRYARRFPNSVIYAVEPLPANVVRIHEALRRYAVSNVRVLPIALSDSAGTATMYVSSGHPQDMPESDDWDYGNKSSSLLHPDQVHAVHPWLHFDEVTEVETATLADVCEDEGLARIDFIHLDVQGAEIKVLTGAADMVDRVTGIWLEVERVPLYRDQPLKSDVERFLQSSGFRKVKDTVDEISGDQLWVRGRRLQWRLLRASMEGVVYRGRMSVRRRLARIRASGR